MQYSCTEKCAITLILPTVRDGLFSQFCNIKKIKIKIRLSQNTAYVRTPADNICIVHRLVMNNVIGEHSNIMKR